MTALFPTPRAACFVAALLAAAALAAPARADEPDWSLRLLRAAQAQRHGRWKEAEDEFRELLRAPNRRGAAGDAVTIAMWKGPVVAGSDFAQDYARGAARDEKYSAFGRSLLAQGYAALAAVEFERAAVLGDTSEETYAALLDCYRRSGDRAGLNRTRALAAAHHPAMRVGARTEPGKNRNAAATLDYPSWIDWSAPLRQQRSYLSAGAVRRGDLIVYPLGIFGNMAGVAGWSLSKGTATWIFDLNADLPGRGMKPAGQKDWHSRSVKSLAFTPEGVRLGYTDQLNRTTPNGGSSSSSADVTSGAFVLDPKTGTVLSQKADPTPPGNRIVGSCPDVADLKLESPCSSAHVDGNDAFLALDDRSILRVDLRRRRIVWKSAVDDAPKGNVFFPAAPRRRGSLLVVPGATRALTAFDADTGRRLWSYPIVAYGPLEISGPEIMVPAAFESRLVGLRRPADLERRRAALAALSRRQKDDELAVEIALNAVDADGTNSAAALALADRFHGRAPPARVAHFLTRLLDVLSPDDPAYAALVARQRELTPVRWTARLEGEAVAALSFDDARVYLLGQRTLAAFDRESGKEVWRRELPRFGTDLTGWARMSEDAGVLYFCAGSDGLMAVEAATGRVLWRKEWSMPPQEGSGAYLLGVAAGDGALFGSLQYYVQSAPGKIMLGFYALNEKDGSLLWRRTVGPASPGSFWTTDARAVRDRGLLFFPMPNGTLYAFDEKDGHDAWTFRLELSSGTMLSTMARPLARDGRLYLTGTDGRLYALNAQTGSVDWKKDVGTLKSGWGGFDSLALVGDQLCLGVGGFGCVDVRNGNVNWQTYGLFAMHNAASAGGALWLPIQETIRGFKPDTGAPLPDLELPGTGQVYSVQGDGNRLYAVRGGAVIQLAADAAVSAAAH